jgi:ADP-ribose pyrophosphatase YjhB (NUDIX family)
MRRGQFNKVRHRPTVSSVDKETSFRASENSSESSSDWRSKSSAPTLSSSAATSAAPVLSQVAAEAAQVVVVMEEATPPPVKDDAQIFRHYRSRQWKYHYRTKLSPGKKRIKCRHSYGIILQRRRGGALPSTPSIHSTTQPPDHQTKDGIAGGYGGSMPPQYLVQRRRHSIGLSEMVRSRWTFDQSDLIFSLCGDMTDSERMMLGDIRNFRRLWVEVRADEGRNDFESQYFLAAERKMSALIRGHVADSSVAVSSDSADITERKVESKSDGDDLLNLQGSASPLSSSSDDELEVHLSSSEVVVEKPQVVEDADATSVKTYYTLSWKEICEKQTIRTDKPALEFSKGRRDKDSGESEMQCARRELKEETGIREDQYEMLNVSPIKEMFIGINGYRYIYIYYLARMKPGKSDKVFVDEKNVRQFSEVSEVFWSNHESILASLRPQDSSRVLAFKKAHLTFQNTSSIEATSTKL